MVVRLPFALPGIPRPFEVFTAAFLRNRWVYERVQKNWGEIGCQILRQQTQTETNRYTITHYYLHERVKQQCRRGGRAADPNNNLKKKVLRVLQLKRRHSVRENVLFIRTQKTIKSKDRTICCRWDKIEWWPYFGLKVSTSLNPFWTEHDLVIRQGACVLFWGDILLLTMYFDWR